jgi:hypothetical protein
LIRESGKATLLAQGRAFFDWAGFEYFWNGESIAARDQI